MPTLKEIKETLKSVGFTSGEIVKLKRKRVGGYKYAKLGAYRSSTKTFEAILLQTPCDDSNSPLKAAELSLKQFQKVSNIREERERAQHDKKELDIDVEL